MEMKAPRRMSRLARLCIGLFAGIVGVVLVSCALMLSYLALIIDMLILAPVVMLMHGLLRYWSAG